MEIVLKAKENLNIIYKDKCPCCNKEYNQTKRKKSSHHLIPSFMKSKTEIGLTICKECHEELNTYYDSHMIRKKTGGKEPENPDFNAFLLEYRVLRKKFKDNKIHRGEFGEGLWKNLVSHLHFINDARQEKAE